MRSYRTIALATLALTSMLPACGAAPNAKEASYAPAPADAGGASQAAYPQPHAQPGQAPTMDSAGATAPAEEAEAPMDADAAPPQPAPVAQRQVLEKKTAAAKPPAIAGGAVANDDGHGTEDYTDYGVNPVTDPAKDPLSTFAIDVDTGAYAIARSKLRSNTLPPFQSVRAEEFVNYFDYEYQGPTDGSPFAVQLHAAPSPYQRGHQILRVGVQAKRVSKAQRKPVHLVYLVDTSGSMTAANKLGLAKKSLKILTKELKPTDTVALCTYAGSTRLVLPPTAGSNRSEILKAIDDLTSGGGTAMSNGMEMAYELAQKTHVRGHVSRVIVLSDGDANIGRNSHQSILERIGHFKDQGITLSTVGFGRGNYKDTMMEQLANEGDGNYSYIDTEAEARRAFGEQLGGMLEVVAKDVKIQVEFDPRVVQSYRLIGYENRDVADKDFRNDKVDAGEIGAGHDVTALYDVVLKGQPSRDRSPVIVRLRHKKPQGTRAVEMAVKMGPEDVSTTFASSPASYRFAVGVAGLAEVLRKSPHAKSWSLSTVERIVDQARWGQKEQNELLALVRTARRLSPEPKRGGPAIMAK